MEKVILPHAVAFFFFSLAAEINLPVETTGPFSGRTKGRHDKNRFIQNLAQPDEFRKCLSARHAQIEICGFNSSCAVQR